MPRSGNTTRAALAVAVLPAVLAISACGGSGKPAAATTPPASASASVSTDAASPAAAASTATSEPAPATATTATAVDGAKKICGAVKGLEDYKLVVAGSVSCAAGEKVLWAYLKQGAFMNQRGGAVDVNGWSCIFSRNVHATISSSDGFSCWRGSDTAQLLDPHDTQAGGSGPR